MKPISKTVQATPASGIRKFFDIVSQMEDVISLGVGEPDFVTPWRIREACIYSLEKGFATLAGSRYQSTAYTSNYGLLELRQLISSYLELRHGLQYDPENQILITVGVSEGLDLALRAILDPGDEVIVAEPCYVSYKPCVAFAGGVPVVVSSDYESRFQITAKQVKAAVTPKTKAVLISYPSNPTGATIDQEELTKIVNAAVENDLYILSDEIYDKLTYDSKHTCVPTIPGAYERTIYFNGFSKAYAMTGWRIAYAASNPEIIETMMKIHQYTMLCAPMMGQIAAIEALQNGNGDSDEMIEQYNHRRRVIVNGLNKLGLKCMMPGGAFYAFPSIKSTGMTSEEFAERLLFEEKVAVVPGNAFGDCGEGHIRCSYATSIERIEEALARMERLLGKL